MSSPPSSGARALLARAAQAIERASAPGRGRLLVYGVLFAIGLAVYAGVAGDRTTRQSTDPHFVYLADAWLGGKLAIDPPPPRGDDWAKVETIELRDGTVVRGRRLQTRRFFRTTAGDELPLADIARSRGTTHYVSFPPTPALLMVPGVIMGGRDANDVFPTILCAALILPLAFSVLRRLSDAGLSRRTASEDLWLVFALAFGTVLFFSAVQGRVWFTAHVVGVALCLGYVRCAIEARRPVLAGLLLGLATLTRTPMAFLFPLFLWEAWRVAGGRAGLRTFLRTAALFAAPIALFAVLAMIHNQLRFDSPLEFGHAYLAVRQQAQMETTGMFSLDYLGRQLAVAFTLLPDLSTTAPYISISGHGLAMWVTTPLLLLVLWPREKGPLHRPLWLTVALVALPTFLYQNSGWLQFGYRFALDYLVLLIVLVAVGGRRLGAIGRALIIAGIVINLFGAVTFARDWKYYRTDARAYQCVIDH